MTFKCLCTGKNSNEMALCSQQHTQTLQPYQGRNPCMERNLMVQSNSMEQLACNGNILIDKSSKHSSSSDQSTRLIVETQVLIPQDYLAQNTSQIIQMRPATPIPYVQNVISENVGPSYNKLKQTNVYESSTQESPRKKSFGGWSTFKKLLSNRKLLYSHSKCQIDREDSKSNLLMKQKKVQANKVETNVTLSSRGKYVNEISSSSASFIEKNDKNTSSQISNRNCDNDDNHLVGKPCTTRPSTLPLLPLRSKKSENNLSKQTSINKFNEVFNVGSSVNSLKDPNMRIKTPGDLPPSVRKVRGRSSQSTARFSLYDDRIMCNILNEDDNQSDKTIMSNSVPFGMDLDCNSSKTLPPKLNAKDITCF